MAHGRTLAALGALAVSLVLLAAGCGDDDKGTGDFGAKPAIGKKEDPPATSGDGERSTGFAAFATKNTTRVSGDDPVADAAGVAQAVFSAGTETNRPNAVTFVDAKDWRGGIAASVLVSDPVKAPILLTEGDEVPEISDAALRALRPRGAAKVDGAQVIRVGDVPEPDDVKSIQVEGGNPYALARDIDRLHAAARGSSSDRVVIVSADSPAYAMPAAGWAAKSGDPILYVDRNRIPPETRSALRAHQQPKIYVLGPPNVISERVVRDLRRLGTVKRIQGRTPIQNAIAFARYTDGGFGWGVVDPGHGLIFVNEDRTLDAAAAAPLSASGTYAPILLVDKGGSLPDPVLQYLLDIQPGYERDPVRGVYNHGWLIGNEDAISVAEQSRIDALLEIAPVNAPPPSATGEGDDADEPSRTTTTPGSGPTRTQTSTAPTQTTTTTTSP